jgi:hypothetical protein
LNGAAVDPSLSSGRAAQEILNEWGLTPRRRS